jgi:hypothetical protein
VPRGRPRERVKIQGVTYVREVVVPPKPKDPYKPTLKHHYAQLEEPQNEFVLEGSITLPPLKLAVKKGRRAMTKFMVGHRAYKGGPPNVAYMLAYDDIAELVLDHYKQGDHVIVRGGFLSYFGRGYCYVNHVVQQIEMVAPAPAILHPVTVDVDADSLVAALL